MEPNTTQPTTPVQPDATIVSPPPKKSRRGIVRMLVIALLVLVLATVGVAIYNKNNRPEPVNITAPEPKTAIVQITDQGFIPATLSVAKGTIVIWQGSGNTKPAIVAANPYPTNDSVPGLKSEQLGNGASYRHQFNDFGTFQYHDDLNPKVNGVIIVQ